MPGLTRFVALALAVCLAPFVIAAEKKPSLGQGRLVRGPYAVGFEALSARDRSRSLAPVRGSDRTRWRDPGRTVQILVWYPAAPDASGEALTFGTFLSLSVTGERPASDAQEAAQRRMAMFAKAYALPDAESTGLFDAATSSIAGAPRAKGPFPVLLYASSFGAPAYENFPLFEHLASHGYIVASIPSVGVGGREMTNDTAGLTAQERDAQFAIGVMQGYAEADPARLATAGFSYGGLVSVLLALNDVRVGAVVSLDGSIVHGRFSQPAQPLHYFTPDNLRVPFLLLLRAGAERDPGFDDSFYRGLRYAECYRVVFTAMAHTEFAAISHIVRERTSIAAEREREPVLRTEYDVMCEYVRRFLDAQLRNDADARAWLEEPPSAHGLATAATLERRHAAPLPPSEAEFIALFEQKGIEAARTALRDARRDNPAIVIVHEETLNNLGYGLLGERRFREAIEVLTLAVEAFPRSANAQDSLGEAYFQAGNAGAAQLAYRRALDLLPKDDSLNDAARRRLREHIEGVLEKIRN